jgi:hypothetical protein
MEVLWVICVFLITYIFVENNNFSIKTRRPQNFYHVLSLWMDLFWLGQLFLFNVINFFFFWTFFTDWLSKYFGVNSVIFYMSSYCFRGLRPRCWIRITCGCRSLRSWTVRPLNFYMIWVQVGVSQTGFYLIVFIVDTSTKGPCSENFSKKLLY